MIRCGECGHLNREERRFCSACGSQVGWTCDRCGFFNFPEESFCGGCGRAEEDRHTGESPSPPIRRADRPSPTQTAPPELEANSDVPLSRDDQIISQIGSELEKMTQEKPESDSAKQVSQDDIDEIFK